MVGVASTASYAVDWPAAVWLTATPAEAGMDPALLDQARTYAVNTNAGGGSGFITRGGRLVLSWGDTALRYDLKSTTKSIGGSILGLALLDGLVALDDAAQLHLPDVGVPPDTNIATGWLGEITLHHLSTQSSGFEKDGGFGSLLFQPGTTWSYSDGGANWLADVLTVVYGDDLNTVLFDRVVTPIGVTATDLVWRNNAYRGDTIDGIKRREFGSGIRANVDAMARIGYLYLRGGVWDGTTILPASFVDQARGFQSSLLYLPVNNVAEHANATSHYGLLWWNNADGSLPGVPTDAYWAWGLGDSLIIVIPSLDIVVARAGDGWRTGWDSDYSVLAPFLQPIVDSVVPDVGNLAPTARSDGFQVDADSSANVLPVLESNGSGADSDPESDALTIVKVGTPDAGGSVVPSAASDTLIYTPAAGFTGVETFPYTIGDGHGAISTATVTMSVDSVSVAPGGDFQQDGTGLVSMEAESYHASVAAPDGHEWLSAGAIYPGYSGTDALQALPEDTISYTDPGYSSLTPRLDYQVNFSQTGTHYVWVRAWGPLTSSNSLHVGLDGEELLSSSNMRLPDAQRTSYLWVGTVSGGARATFEVNATGTHTINLWMRESGTVIDKLVVTSDAGYDPSTVNGGLGPDESSTAQASVQAPTISPNGGVFSGPVSVSLSTATGGADIHYTLDGSNPTQASTLYTSAFEVSANTTVKARAYRDGYVDSPVSSAVFQIQAQALPTGLIDYWKLDEGGGSSYANVIGGRPTASCSACPTPVAGRIGGGQQFDGTTQGLSVADDSAFDWSSSARFSIEAWIKRDVPCSVTGETVVGRRDASSQLEWALGCEGSNARFRLIDTIGGGGDVVGTTDIADGQWHHVVAVRDAISGRNLLYVDGVEEASASPGYAGSFVGSAGLGIGWLDTGGADRHFGGVIDEVAVHGRVLPASEIRRHHADGVVGLQRGYWGCEAPVRIMPLGDSITRRWNPGYRPGLYFELIDAGMNVDMVGGMVDNCSPNCAHDPDNEGHSGFTATQIANNVATYLNNNPPDVLTLHIGTNEDASFPYPSVASVEAILDGIDAYDADIPVVLARIINKARTSYDPGVSAFNANLEAMAQARVAAGDRIVVVDQEPRLDYSDTTVDFAVGDDLHPTATGFGKMVPVWFDGLNQFMPACNVTQPQTTSQAVVSGEVGSPYLYTVETLGFPMPSFSLLSAPAGMTIHPDTGQITWTPSAPGTFDVSVQVQSPGGTTTQNFTVTVTGTALTADGDINGDGQVDAVDVMLAQRIILDQYVPTTAEFLRGDVAPVIGGVPSPDGQINLGDLVVIQKTALSPTN